MRVIDVFKGVYHASTISYRVGYRLRSSNDHYVLLKNPPNCWCADPFLFEYNEKIYVFAEVFDSIHLKGSIGYCEIPPDLKTDNVDWHIVIEEDYHLSYPFIWQDADGIHIAAETASQNNLYRYDCEEFPYRWKKGTTLLEGKPYADSTFLMGEDGFPAWCLTHEVTGPLRGRLYRYAFRDGRIDPSTETFLTDDPVTCRPGGAFFTKDGRLLRVAQDCAEDYGKRVVLLDVEEITPYQEKPVGEMSYREHPYVEDCIGLHTYNMSEHGEVVDFRIKKRNIPLFFRSVTYRIFNKLRKMLFRTR